MGEAMPNSHVDGDLNDLGLETIAKQFALVYKTVTLADLPMYRWLQIVNDVTILTEETRRGVRRQEQAQARALKVLLRLLDFIGFYLHVLPDTVPPNAKFIAECLQSPSYKGFFRNGGPKEGPTRWILAKYPKTCAKCGEERCHCIVTPWVFEERRQDPEEFFAFRDKVYKKRRQLKKIWDKKPNYFTLPGLFQFFADIYRSSYYHLDTWKIVMHLSEEVGEATTELSRLELLFLMRERSYPLSTDETWAAIKGQTKDIITDKLGSINLPETKRKVTEKTLAEMEKEIQSLRHKPDASVAIASLVTEKFKEEIADVFSWLSAVLYQLSEGAVVEPKRLMELLRKHKYIKTVKYHLTLTCPQCGESECENSCLVENAAAAEVYEKVAQL
jgi:hypothetical protein